MIRIDNKTNIESIENAYQELSISNSVDIVISKSLSGTDFGLIPAIIQFFITWYNITTNSKIILDIKSEDELSEFYELDYLFPSIVYCWSSEIVDVKGTDLKPLLKLHNQVKHEKMKKQTEGGGQKYCFRALTTFL